MCEFKIFVSNRLSPRDSPIEFRGARVSQGHTPARSLAGRLLGHDPFSAHDARPKVSLSSLVRAPPLPITQTMRDFSVGWSAVRSRPTADHANDA